jgi:hypothetical protein
MDLPSGERELLGNLESGVEDGFEEVESVNPGLST